jgi:hypothetical protein
MRVSGWRSAAAIPQASRQHGEATWHLAVADYAGKELPMKVEVSAAAGPT